MLTWASPFNICCFLDNQGYPGQASSPAGFECLLAAGAAHSFSAPAGDAFSAFKTWSLTHQDWLFGHLGYGLAAETEPAPTIASAGEDPEGRPRLVQAGQAAPPAPTDPIGFPDLFFFVPQTVIELHPDHIRIGALHADPETIWQEISRTTPKEAKTTPPITFTPRFTREEYLATIGALQRHILRGDCYEINFCQEFFARSVTLDPFTVWQALSKASPNPFSAFYRLDDRYLCCASPERFLKKTGATLLSQPIKGTAPRAHEDAETDGLQAAALRRSAKDRAENVMVVDLVRNDLARVCIPGSVQVPELFGVYPFPHVYQMISTVTGELLPGTHWTEAIRACFPMGSMTGAPKNRVVQLIAQYERSRRGLFSGAVGYVTPNGDLDLNVVIRSLLYERQTAYLSYQVGSGITWYSDPAAEYEECLVKAAGIKKALGNT
ncbi:MAG TPA: anthranilate synthase component I family protein [Puia sp.]|nr:anthranilate synthase component I family protein [Puia sp.]